MAAFTLADLLQRMGPSVRLVGPGCGPPAAGRTNITWAHVSELADPTPWLSGGELLLTTGLQLFATKAETIAYCERLAKGDVAALAVSTGLSLTHEQLPPFLPEAAAAAGLPLLEVAEQEPLESVVKTVAAALSTGREQSLTQMSKAQELLVRAVGHPDARRRTLATFERATGAHAALFDPHGHLLGHSPKCPSEVLGELTAAVDQVSGYGIHAASSLLAKDAGIQVHGLIGHDTVIGRLALYRTPPLGAVERPVVGTLASLLAVSMLGVHKLENRMRRLQEKTLGELLHGELNERQAAVRMRRLGLENAELQAVYAVVGDSPVSPPAFARRLESAWNEVITAAQAGLVVALVVDPPDDLTLAPDFQAAGWHVGISHRVRQAKVLTALRQARFACAQAGRSGHPQLSIAELDALPALLHQLDEAARAGFAEAVLAPLDAYDEHHPRSALVTTLRVFLASNLSLESTAAELGLHRHTVRGRVKLICEVAGRDLARSHDRLEFQLALAIRDLCS
jgi:purine catabolism regulator